jgi:hypothetical protein
MKALIYAAKQALKVMPKDASERSALEYALKGCEEPTYVDENGLSIPPNHRVQPLQRKVTVAVVIRSQHSVPLDKLTKVIQQQFEVLDAAMVQETIIARDLQTKILW